MASKNINLILTEEFIVQALVGEQIIKLLDEGWIVNLFFKKDGNWDFLKGNIHKNLKVYDVRFDRKINLINDIKVLFRLIFLLKDKIGLFVYSTPKASLIGSLATFILNKKSRIYVMRGRVYENYDGLKFKFFEIIEKIICSISKDVVFLTQDHRKIFINKKFVNKNNSHVIYNGSSNGINLHKFTNASKRRDTLRKKNGYNKKDIIIIFAARICKDKGIFDFIEITNSLLNKNKNIKLLFVGKNEDNLNLFNYYENKFLHKIKVVGWTNEIENYFAISDILLLPSYREGFGNVYVESSATGCVPFGYDIIGVNTAVKNNFSGILVNLKDKKALYNEMLKKINNKDLLKKLNENGLKYSKKFDRVIFFKKLFSFYEKRIHSLHN